MIEVRTVREIMSVALNAMALGTNGSLGVASDRYQGSVSRNADVREERLGVEVPCKFHLPCPIEKAKNVSHYPESL